GIATRGRRSHTSNGWVTPKRIPKSTQFDDAQPVETIARITRSKTPAAITCETSNILIPGGRRSIIRLRVQLAAWLASRIRGGGGGGRGGGSQEVPSPAARPLATRRRLRAAKTHNVGSTAPTKTTSHSGNTNTPWRAHGCPNGPIPSGARLKVNWP